MLEAFVPGMRGGQRSLPLTFILPWLQGRQVSGRRALKPQV